MKIDFHTFGCKVNTYDTGLMQKNFADSKNTDQNHVMVVNTCAVTGEATKEAIKWIKKYKSTNPQHKIVVTGCSAQVDTELLKDLKEIDLLVANSHKGELKNLIQKMLNQELPEKVFKSNIFKKLDLEPGGGEEDLHTRSFVKIQDGCNSFCTFCVIPFARGKSRSLPASTIVNKINELFVKGIKEVVLTGVHIGDYEGDEAKNLEALVKKVLVETKMPRIRLTSIEPVELSQELLELFGDERMCKHFHMSIQSANTKVLRDMKRKYTHSEVEKSLNDIYKFFPEAYVGMDVIVGFPGETQDEFGDTYQRLDQLPWTRIHVFPYSRRPGTYADRLPEQWERGEIVARARRLRELSYQRSLQRAKEQIGRQKEVLVLASSKKGLARDYWPVALPEKISQMFQVGTEVPVRITGVQEQNNKGLEPRLTAELWS
ncbi:MAG: tRNA (N(6)-L-threonylcarbamoyladenosine(37)-C(2))-methylthiotransferase MtaB [Bdellovibrionales bacterium]|nr:tRNA (N(6)-L-threonylcarbamoyladenosine(37)-C(2))-methylthiotransferase MtaB [Bdellovibrionales bacterium]